MPTIVASQLANRALTAEATQTQICTCLSVILLGGLGLTAVRPWTAPERA